METPTEAQPVQRKARRKKPVGPGAEAVEFMRRAGVVLPPEQEQEICKLTDAQGLRCYLESHLPDSVNPSKLVAISTFGQYLLEKIEVKNLVTVRSIYALEQTQLVLDDCAKVLANNRIESSDNPLTLEQRMGVMRVQLLAADQINKINREAMRMLPHLQASKEKPKVRNAAPDVLNQVNIQVQSAPSEVRVVEKRDALPTLTPNGT